MDKIIIPAGAETYATGYGGKLAYHVGISDPVSFNKFCLDNNIGYHDGSRRDVTKSDLHVFTHDKSIFQNFPDKVELMM